MYAKVHHREIRVFVLGQQLVESIPRLINPLFFSLLKVNHLHPYMLNFAYREKLGTKFLYQLIPISLDFKGLKGIPLYCFIGK
jgi:hypothetical protein